MLPKAALRWDHRRVWQPPTLTKERVEAHAEDFGCGSGVIWVPIMGGCGGAGPPCVSPACC